MIQKKTLGIMLQPAYQALLKSRICIVVFSFFFTNVPLFSQNPNPSCDLITLSPDQEFFSINSSIFILEDKEGSLTLEDVRSREAGERFTRNTTSKLNFGYTSSTYWVKFCIRNPVPEINDWLMEINYSHIDSIEFYHGIGDNIIFKKYFGDMYPFAQRELAFRTFIIKLQHPDTMARTYYARFKTQGSMQFPMNIYREQYFVRKYYHFETYYGFFLGIMFALIIYNLCVYFSLKDISYLYYVMLIFATTLFQVLMSGHVFQYILKNSMWLNNSLIPSSIAFSEFCMVLFARSFLNVRKYSVGLHRLLSGLLILSLILTVVIFFIPYHISAPLAAHTALIFIFVSILSGVICLRKGNKAAPMYILAFTLLFIGSVAVSLTALGFFSRNSFTSHGMEVGSMLHWIFLTLALTDNYRLNIREKIKIQEEIIEMRRQTNEQLEQKVRERTIEIEVKNEELNHQKEELQATLDYLKQTQVQLIESEKLSALGGLVAGVAHEINTPVGIGVTAVSNLQEEIQKMADLFKQDEISRKDFKEFLESANDATLLIQKNLARTAELIQSFKQVSAEQLSEQQRNFNLRCYLDDIIRSLYPKLKDKDVDFNIYCDDDLFISSYPGTLAQIFTNLLLNSIIHGFDEGYKGLITIRAARKNKLLTIEYSDNGNGINKNDLTHIFEPFYTSDKNKGTGLGLHIVYNLIKQKLHGSISCESEPGKGVLFKIIYHTD